MAVERKIIGLSCFDGGFRRSWLMCRQQLMMMYDTDSVAVELHALLNEWLANLQIQHVSAKQKLYIER
jgi:hypothetical protein